jgi:hypothetical protein
MTFTAKYSYFTSSSLKADLKRSLKLLIVLKAFLLITHLDERHRQLNDLFVIPLSVDPHLHELHLAHFHSTLLQVAIQLFVCNSHAKLGFIPLPRLGARAFQLRVKI